MSDNKKHRLKVGILSPKPEDEGKEPHKKAKRPYKRRAKLAVQKSWRNMGHADN